MSGDQSVAERPVADRPSAARGDTEELAVQVELLREENRRLREARRHTLQTRYRRTGLGLVALGTVALAGAVLLPDARDVLLALAGVGLFAGLLVFYVTPERFVAAAVGDRVFEAYARTGADLVADLGLADHRVYVPIGDGARLFVPQHEAYEVPNDDDLDGVLVVTDDDRRRGIAVHPTGEGLFGEFERTTPGGPADDPTHLADQLADALVSAFELAEGATASVEQGRLTVAVSGPVYGDVGAFDHPIASLVGVGVARTLGHHVTVEVSGATDDRADALVTATWPPTEDD